MARAAIWNYPTPVRFGPGRVAELPEALALAGITWPLVVTDRGLADQPITHRVLEVLEQAGVPRGLFSDVQSNPVGSSVESGVDAFRRGGHDGIVAFGGGSALDMGKVIAFMSGQTRPVWDFEDVGNQWKRADPGGIAPVVAIPTTAGTGSEVGRSSVITDEATHIKRVIFHPAMLPAVVIADPELTVGMPRQITIGTGFDALAHCVEAYCAVGYHPMADGMAVEGVRLVLENLERVVEEPGNLVARGHMMSAAAIGATAFQKGLGAIHAMSHPVGALHDTHHGMTNAVFMPHVLRANRAVIEARIVRLAAWCGLPASFDAFLDAIVALQQRLGAPTTLRELGVTDEHRKLIGERAVLDPTAGGNPVPLTRELALTIFDRAL